MYDPAPRVLRDEKRFSAAAFPFSAQYRVRKGRPTPVFRSFIALPLTLHETGVYDLHKKSTKYSVAILQNMANSLWDAIATTTF